MHIGFKGYVDGSIEFYGDQIELLTGYLREEFNSKKIKWTDLILEEDVGNSSEIFKQALKTDKTYARGYRIRLKNGDTLIVGDNGTGFPGDLDFRNTGSLGLRLVNILTAQLDGTIELDRSGGTAFKITFPGIQL